MAELIQHQQNRSNIPAIKLALWVGCASIMMMFAAFTSAYVVRKGAGNWLEFKLPNQFFISTLFIILSSITLQLTYQNFKKGNELLYKTFMTATFILGVSFLAMQYLGWKELTKFGIFLDGNPSGSFVYLISGTHATHVLGGLIVLIVALAHAFILPFKPVQKRLLRLEMTLTYWHFVDFLWLYVLLFILYS